MTRTVLVTVAVVASLFMAGCGSKDTEAESTTSSAASSAESSSAATEDPKPARSDEPEEPGASEQTLNQYLADNGISRNFIAPDAADVPQPVLQVPAGWTDVGSSRPQNSWGMLALTATMESPDPTMILVGWAKLDGPVDPATVLDLAPVSVTQFPEFDGPEAGERGQVSGFDSVEIAGSFMDEGKPAYTAQKWVVIPLDSGTYELFFMAKGPPDQEAAMNEAMSALSSGTTIPTS